MTSDHAAGVIGAIKAEAARRDVSHAQLAEAIGVSRASMSRRMSGDVPFSFAEVRTIAETLGVSVALLDEDGSRHVV